MRRFIIALTFLGGCMDFHFGSTTAKCPDPPNDHSHYIEAQTLTPGSSGCSSATTTCVLTCDSGWASCGNSCNTHVADDHESCGACGRKCDRCASGSCQEVRTVVEGSANALAVLGDDILWVDAKGNLMRRAIAGGEPRGIATNVVGNLAVDITGIYFLAAPDSTHLEVRRIRDEMTTVIDSREVILAVNPMLAMDRTSVYWIINPGGTGKKSAIVATPKNGNPSTTLLDLTSPYDVGDIATGGGFVYFADALPKNDDEWFPPMGVFRAPASGGSEQQISTGPATLVGADDTFVWFVDSVLKRRAHAGGKVDTFAATKAAGLAFDDEASYVGAGSDLLRIALNGETVALAGLQNVRSIAVENDQIFWSTDSAIRSAQTRLP